ncbi:MAG: protein-glutamate O-methyltransferase CheR [Calditrichaeota bacterium]|nr:protein-glutamate O-methyltransferase CheR [Calditrichota bacterium]
MGILTNIELSGSNITLSEPTFLRLRDFIYQRTGIFFPDNKKYFLENRLYQRLKALNINDFETYVRKIQNGLMDSELQQLINQITINETFFFRNEAQLEALERHIFPELFRRARQRPGKSIRIWSAACSTGEEPYTLAILLQEKFRPLLTGIRVEILATDINSQVLQKARQGLYRDYAVRKIAPGLLQRYFQPQSTGYQIAPEIRQMVQFRQLNLMDRWNMQQIRGMDVIICANVLLYFDERSKRQVVNSLYDSLNPGGYLLLGYSESLYGVSHAFKPVHFTKTIVYKKECHYA